MKQLFACLLLLLLAAPVWAAETEVTDYVFKLKKKDMREWGYGKNDTILIYNLKTTIPPGMHVYVGLKDASGKVADGYPLYGSSSETAPDGSLSGWFLGVLTNGLSGGDCELKVAMVFEESATKKAGYAALNGRFIGQDDNKRKTFEQLIPVRLPDILPQH